MARDTTDDTPISSVDELAAYLASGCKPKDKWRIGTEHEKFPFFTEDNEPVPYEGERSIKALLEGMARCSAGRRSWTRDRIIGLVRADRHGRDLAGARRPVRAVRRAAGDDPPDLPRIQRPPGTAAPDRRSARHQVSRPRRSPKWTLAETPRMPKSRYDIMRAYMPKVGKPGSRHDAPDLDDPGQSRLFLGSRHAQEDAGLHDRLQPLATALFANSPFTEGKPNGLFPGAVISGVIRQPSVPGSCPSSIADDFGFMDYVEWVLDVPMYFVLRDGRYRDCDPCHLPPVHGWRLEGRTSRADAERWATGPTIWGPCFPKCPAEALHRNARRRRRTVAADLRAAGVLGRAAL
jgi:glutamate--cysteine ligase